MAIKKKEPKKDKKARFFEKIYDILGKYKKALLVNVQNISADQIHQTRKGLRDLDSIVLMGKNTLIRKVIEARLKKPVETDRNFEEKTKNWTPIDHWEPLLKTLKGNVAIIFTNGDVSACKDIMEKFQREAPARAGQIAQCDVWIKSGSTGLDPKQTSFFQQLNIATKIVKSVIEIVSDTKVITKGDLVEPSHQVLLEKLRIKPFSYKLSASSVIDNGKIFDPRVLDIKPADILAKYVRALNNVAAVSFEIGYPTLVSVRHSLVNSFKNLASVTYETEYTFPQADKLKSAATAAPVAAAGAPVAAAPAKAPEPVEDVVVKPFGGDDDEY